MEKHTLVMPYSPNIVPLFMSWLILCKEKVRDMLGVSDAPDLKFIAAGPLRKEDWKGEGKPDARNLEEKGYLFLDCGGGRFDSQSLPEALRSSKSSLELLTEAVELDKLAPHLLPVMAIINAQGKQAQRVAVDPHHRDSNTPHTARHLKNMILGWNLMYGPEKVVQLVHQAFSGIYQMIDNEAVDPLPADKAISRTRELFLLDQMVIGVNDHLLTEGCFTDDAEVKAGEGAEQFRGAAEQALQVWEEEWNESVKDYWTNARLRTVIIAERKGAEIIRRKGTVVIGTSDSERFSQVARLGNEGHPDARPFQGKPFRYKADVVVQFHRDGRFHISTRGEICLDEVAKLVREADLIKKGVSITPALRVELARPGNLIVKNERGSLVETIYFPEYRKGLGNAFRSNPHSSRCLVHSKEIEDLTCKGLALQLQ